MELKLEDLTLEQLKEISEAVDKEINERRSKAETEHAKDLAHALDVCLSECNSYLRGYIYLYSSERCEELEFDIEEVLQTVLDALKEDT